MGNWAVMAQYSYGEAYRTEFICRGLETEDEALKALREAVHTYLPSRSIIEKRRQVYRFPGQESYLVVIKGKLTEWECTLRVMELLSDSADPTVAERAVAERAQTGLGAAEAADGPQDRVPPGY